MKNRQNQTRLRVGRDWDTWRHQNQDVLDLQAPIYEQIAVTQPEREMMVQFSEHQESVSRETWYRLIQQEIQKVTQNDMAVRSQYLNDQDELMLIFVNPGKTEFQCLNIVTANHEPHFAKNQLWTGYFPSIKLVLKQIRQYLSNQAYSYFTFAMYAYLRMNATQKLGQQPAFKCEKNHVYYGDAQHTPIAAKETQTLLKLEQKGLIRIDTEGVKTTALGISTLNYFARFYEREFLERMQMGDGSLTQVKQHASNHQRKMIHLPAKVIKND